MDEIKGATAAFDAEQTLVGGAVIGFGVHDFAIFDNQIELASGCAVGTGSQDFFLCLPGPVVFPALHGQGASGTCLHAVSAGFTDSLGPVFHLMGSDFGVKAPVQRVDGAASYDLLASVDAPAAENAQASIICKELIGIIHGQVVVSLALIAGGFHTVLITVILQFAVSIGLAGETMHPVIGEQKIQGLFPVLDYFFRHGLYFIALGAGKCAGCAESCPAVVGDFYDAQTAGAIGQYVFQMTEGWDFNAQLSGSLQDCGVLFHFYRNAVYF